jgi:hypothetical protein
MASSAEEHYRQFRNHQAEIVKLQQQRKGRHRDALIAEALVTPLATPSGDAPGEWALAKLQGYAVDFGAISATSTATESLKVEMDRRRPWSFPQHPSSRNSSLHLGYLLEDSFSANLERHLALSV